VALAAWPVQAQDLPDLGGREITVVTENAYPPLQFLDAEGSAVGWEYDAMAEIAKRLNATVTYENISWDAMIPAVSEGQFDLGMTGITIRDDRKEVVDFSEPYMTSQMLMIVRADEDRFTDAASFAATPISSCRLSRGPRRSTLRSTHPRRRRSQSARGQVRDLRGRPRGAPDG
jgi:polar amino acid transport system substrate-binding protein